jgi:hypothetical protein
MNTYGLYDGNHLVDHGSLNGMAYELYKLRSIGEGDHLKVYKIEINQIEEIPREVYDSLLDEFFGDHFG